jgi:hypothetical protein
VEGEDEVCDADTQELLQTEETDPDRSKGDKTKKKKYLGRINYKVSWGHTRERTPMLRVATAYITLKTFAICVCVSFVCVR